jgi:hypothetical protein
MGDAIENNKKLSKTLYAFDSKHDRKVVHVVRSCSSFHLRLSSASHSQNDRHSQPQPDAESQAAATVNWFMQFSFRAIYHTQRSKLYFSTV